jgi:alpha-mannosidase
VTFAGPVTAAREINAQEQPVGGADVAGGALVTSFTPYQPRTFALRVGAPATRVTAPRWQSVQLNYNLSVASNDDTKVTGGGMDGKGDTLPAEMLPGQIDYDGIGFKLAPHATDKPDAITAIGQQISLPTGSFNRVYILAASSDGDQTARFRVGDQSTELKVEAWNGFVGQWDTRIWKERTERDWATSANHAVWPAEDMVQREGAPPSPHYPEDYVGLQSGYIKPASLAWYASHHHTPDGLNEPYQYSYLFAYVLDLPKTAHTLTLPNNGKIRILAISVANVAPALKPAVPLHETLSRSEPVPGMEQARY